MGGIVVDNKNPEPIVLGTIKKGRTGKPFLAIFIIILIGSLIYFLPTIQKMFKDESIIDLIKSGELIYYLKHGERKESVPSVDETYSDFVKIESGSLIQNNNIIISDIYLVNNVLSYSIKSKNATYDATNDNLYLQIYEGKDKLIYTKNLDEIYTITSITSKENIITSNGNSEFYISLKNITDNDIPDITLTSDESGVASLVCSLEAESFEYIFSNKKLIEIERTYKYKYDEEKEEEYTTNYKKYNDLKNEREKYNIIALLEENYYGFSYSEKIDLKEVDVSQLSNDYYSLNTEAKVIKFKQEAKGYDCE